MCEKTRAAKTVTGKTLGATGPASIPPADHAKATATTGSIDSKIRKDIFFPEFTVGIEI